MREDSRDIEQLHDEITAKKEEIEYLNPAFDKMCTSFDQIKAKHDDLATKLQEKEDEITMRIREQLKLQQTQTQQAKELQKYQEAMRSLEDLNAAKTSETQAQTQRAEWLRAQLVCRVAPFNTYTIFHRYRKPHNKNSTCSRGWMRS